MLKNYFTPNVRQCIRSMLGVLAVLPLALVLKFIQKRFPQTWEENGDYLQKKWENLLDNYQLDDEFLWIYVSVFTPIFVYWTVGLCYEIIDLIRPPFITRYKIQPGTHDPLDTKKVIKAIFIVLLNQFAVAFPSSYIFFHISQKFGLQLPSSRTLPTLHSILISLIYLEMTYEVVFYYAHRSLHNRYLYKYIHKRHHEWSAPIAIAANYCHPLEHLISNLLPSVLGPALIQADVVTTIIWYILVVINSLYIHSGYHLPFIPSNEFHNFHHLKFNVNYGEIGLLDALHGTDMIFQQSAASQRNVWLFSVKSAREIVPEPSSQKKCS